MAESDFQRKPLTYDIYFQDRADVVALAALRAAAARVAELEARVRGMERPQE
jgi:hypothetical protein